MKLRLACAGSLPPRGDSTTYPFSHIGFWLEKQLELQYSIVGTGEPGGRSRHGLVERFTQDIVGVEVRVTEGKAKSYCTGKVKPVSKPENSKETVEIKYLASIVPGAVLKKATITDPVTIGFELIVNDPRLVRSYPEIYDDVTEALKPIVGAISNYVDIVQFDCPSHISRPLREPWRYVNQLSKMTGKRTWIHIDGDISQMLPMMIKKYDADVLNINLYGREEENNFHAIAESKQMLQDIGKKLVPAVVSTQIRDLPKEVDSVEKVYSRISRLSSVLGPNMLEAATPGCGLRILHNTAETILERLQTAVRGLA